MSVALILLSLAALCLGTFGWLFLCAGLRRDGWRGVVGRLAVQVSLLVLIYGVLRGQPVNGIFMAVFSPLAVVQVVNLLPQAEFAGRVLWAAAPYGVAALVACLIIGRLRIWAPGVAGVVLLVAAVIAGEGISREAMCSTARGFDSFARNGLMWSLANAPRDWQFDVHALAEVDGQVLGWSYATMDWYAMPETASVGSGEVFTCPK